MSKSTMSFVPNGEFVYRTVAGEGILVPVRGGMEELDSLFSFNEVGAFIWQLVTAGQTVAEIVEAVVDEFEVERDEAERDVLGYLTSLQERSLIEPSAETP